MNAEFTYDREEMRIVDLRTGQHIPPLHELLQQVDKARQARDDVWSDWDSECKAYEARIAELEAKLRARGACTN